MTRGRASVPAGALVAMLLLGAHPTRGVVVPGTDERLDATGWVDGLAIADTGSGPRQRPQALGELKLDGRIAPAWRARLTLRGRAGGPFEGGHPGLMNFVHEFQNRTPSLEFNEAYLEWRASALQVRAGVLKFAWGKLDGVPPTDVLTPRDLHDPFVRDAEESKIGIPAIQLAQTLPPVPALDLTELRATLVYMPIAVPSRLALAAERWFPPAVKTQSSLRIPKGLVDDILGVPVGLRVPITFRTLNHRAPRGLEEGGIALRLSGTMHGVDWDLYHYTGPEAGPNAQLEAIAGRGKPLGSSVRLPADVYLRQAHDTIHMSGGDAAWVVAGATVRTEVATFLDRPMLRDTSTLYLDSLRALSPRQRERIRQAFAASQPFRVPLEDLFPDRNTVEWGVGVDYLVDGYLPLLQVNQILFTDGGPRQLVADPETRLLASLRKRWLADTLEVELRGAYAFERAAWVVHPRVTYLWGDHWRFRAGYLDIGGPSASLWGQFRANDELTFEARYIF